MTRHAAWLGIVVALSLLGPSAGSAAGVPSKDAWQGAWTLEKDRYDRPWLTFHEASGKTVFRFGCGTHYELDAVYPGEASKQEHTEASIAIANGRTQMDFAGFTYAGPESFPPNTSLFNQADLGHPDLPDAEWSVLEHRFLDMLSSGLSLTVSAGGKSYVLPPVKAPRWRERFQKLC